MSTPQFDVAIIGGGVMGCAAAYFLKLAGVGRTCFALEDIAIAALAWFRIENASS